LTWKDKRIVTLLSNYHNAGMTSIKRIKQEAKSLM